MELRDRESMRKLKYYTLHIVKTKRGVGYNLILYPITNFLTEFNEDQTVVEFSSSVS